MTDQPDTPERDNPPSSLLFSSESTAEPEVRATATQLEQARAYLANADIDYASGAPRPEYVHTEQQRLRWAHLRLSATFIAYGEAPIDFGQRAMIIFHQTRGLYNDPRVVNATFDEFARDLDEFLESQAELEQRDRALVASIEPSAGRRRLK